MQGPAFLPFSWAVFTLALRWPIWYSNEMKTLEEK